MNQLILAPSSDLLPAPLFAPTPKAAQRFVEFFTAQIGSVRARAKLTEMNNIRKVSKNEMAIV